MDILQDSIEHNKGFINHVFSSTEEANAELFNAAQYGIMGVTPIVVLNKLIQKFIPEADTEKSSLELLAEIFLQISIMFCGIIIVHRMITYIPTYSGLKYDNLSLTHVILGFLVIVLSIQTKLGIKVNILVDRALEMWNGPTHEGYEEKPKKKVRSKHVPSQADNLDDENMQGNIFPPGPSVSKKTDMESFEQMMPQGPVAANGMLGGNFGASF